MEMFVFIQGVSKFILGIVGLIVLLQFVRSIRLVPTRTSLIIERLGKYNTTLQPGFHVLVPFIDKVAYKLDLREEAINVDPQECFTRDNVKVEVDGIIYLSVVDSMKASYGITNYRYAAIQLAQTTTRSVIGKIELDKTFEERELVSAKVVEALSEVAEGWGIMVHRYEVKNIVPPDSVRKAMEKQMTAEREKRAMLATAEGKRQSNINESEGKKMELINLSEGEKQRRINMAEGKALEIEAIARATADSIKTIASALAESDGLKAINMRLSQQYISNLAKLANESKEIILPMNLANFDETLKGIAINAQETRD